MGGGMDGWMDCSQTATSYLLQRNFGYDVHKLLFHITYLRLYSYIWTPERQRQPLTQSYAERWRRLRTVLSANAGQRMMSWRKIIRGAAPLGSVRATFIINHSRGNRLNVREGLHQLIACGSFAAFTYLSLPVRISITVHFHVFRGHCEGQITVLYSSRAGWSCSHTGLPHSGDGRSVVLPWEGYRVFIKACGDDKKRRGRRRDYRPCSNTTVTKHQWSAVGEMSPGEVNTHLREVHAVVNDL